jgi:hypothetical protein
VALSGTPYLLRTQGLGLNTDRETLALTLAEKMLKLTDADPDAIEDMIHDTLDAAVLAAQGLKALSDPRSAALFLERGDKRRQARRQRREWESCPENEAFIWPRTSGPVPENAVHDNSAFDFTREPAPENAAFDPCETPKWRAERDAAASSTTSTSEETAPRESTPREDQVPEPIEERPTVSFDPPRGKPFVHDENRHAQRRVRRRGTLITPFDLGPPFT